MSEMQWLVDMISPYCTEEQVGWAVVIIVVGITLSIVRGIEKVFIPKR